MSAWLEHWLHAEDGWAVGLAGEGESAMVPDPSLAGTEILCQAPTAKSQVD